ncbi:MAG: LPS export ABC transporter ATP-binding protein [Pseudomonadota bacterium]
MTFTPIPGPAQPPRLPDRQATPPAHHATPTPPALQDSAAAAAVNSWDEQTPPSAAADANLRSREHEFNAAPEQPRETQQQSSLPQYSDATLARGGEGWLTISGVKKAYKRRNVVQGVSLALRRGESVGLLGPNGAGKTTVFYMVTGLVPADAGTITIDGQDVTHLPMYRRARLGIGYLPQEASIFRGLTVEQNIMAVLELTEPNRRKRKERLDELLEEFRIADRRKLPSIALSGGERRRCEIARALASNPSFMLLDEPFAGVDPLAVSDIQELCRHLTTRGIGVLITDHNWRETLDLVERAYVIYEGQVLTQGNPMEIINNQDVRRVYLGDSSVNAT